MGAKERKVNLGLWGYLTILAAVMELVFAACVFVYIGRLENRTPAPLSEQVGAHKAVLAKLRKRESMSQDEVDYATELVSDARSLLAYAIPAALFTMGFFYVVGCLFMLHEDGGNPSFRTFIGGIPMLTSMNIVAQLRRIAGLKRPLQNVSLTAPESSDELSTA
jgi:predicted membrane-bound mannosyltransferase